MERNDPTPIRRRATATAPEPIEHRTVSIYDLIPHEENYNQHPQTQVDDLKASLRRFGQVEDTVVKRLPDGKWKIAAHEGVTTAGLQLLQSGECLHLKQWNITIVPDSWTEEDVKGYMIASNETARKSLSNDELLAALLQEQQDAGFDLHSLGTDDETLRQMLEAMDDENVAGSEQERDETEDELPEDIETRCKPGDIWQLGQHRLICADAFDPATYKLLLNDRQPHVIINDPPYGMRLDADYSVMKNSLGIIQASGLRSGHKYADVIGDDTDFDASAIVNYFSHVKEQFWFGADYYSSTLGDTMHTGSWLVWDKRLEESADLMFGSCFELIWSKQKHKRDMLRHKWAGVFGLEREPVHKRQHPTQKPVILLEDIILRYTDEGQIILDCFMGSGTALISAERTGRICYGCEISPAYCDVAIARYEAETGQTATLLERVEVPAHV